MYRIIEHHLTVRIDRLFKRSSFDGRTSKIRSCAFTGLYFGPSRVRIFLNKRQPGCAFHITAFLLSLR